MSEWHPIKTAPRNATSVEVMMSDGTIHDDCHYAIDHSGEYQPPFQGWFIPTAAGFTEIDEPSKWRLSINDGQNCPVYEERKECEE